MESCFPFPVPSGPHPTPPDPFSPRTKHTSPADHLTNSIRFEMQPSPAPYPTLPPPPTHKHHPRPTPAAPGAHPLTLAYCSMVRSEEKKPLEAV